MRRHEAATAVVAPFEQCLPPEVLGWHVLGIDLAKVGQRHALELLDAWGFLLFEDCSKGRRLIFVLVLLLDIQLRQFDLCLVVFEVEDLTGTCNSFAVAPPILASKF